MQTRLILFLFIVFFSSRLTAMNCSSENQSTEQLVETINDAINRDCDNDGVTDLTTSSCLSQNTMTKIFTVLCVYCPEEKKIRQLSPLLAEKNRLYSDALRHFTTIAFKNMREVTDITINKAQTLAFVLPGKALDALSPDIKNFIMYNVIKQFNSHYMLSLAEHTGEITSFDICAATGYAATASTDNTVRLWNLNNGGQCIFIQQITHPISVCFNTTGLYIATLQLAPTKTITQWNIQKSSLKATHSIHIKNETPLSVSYLDNNNNKMNVLLLKTSKEDEKTMQEAQFDSVFICNEHNPTPINLGSTESPFYTILCKKSCIQKGSYRAEQDPTSKNILCVYKKKCPALFLCEQAVKNSKPTRQLQNNLERSICYQSLNEYEKNMVQNQIVKKMTQLK